ncbi:hypothetical protein COOONC_02258 [Cooperia oncophora]
MSEKASFSAIHPLYLCVSQTKEGERRRRRPMNTGSKLLERQENEMLFSIIGADNFSLSAAVVELLFVENRQWRLTFRGVISLVKDYQKRAYFLRLYDILSGQKLWDFKLYVSLTFFFAKI